MNEHEVKLLVEWAGIHSEPGWIEHITSKDEPCGCEMSTCSCYDNEYCDEWDALRQEAYRKWREAHPVKQYPELRTQRAEERARAEGTERLLP